MWKKIKKYFEIISQDDIDSAIQEVFIEYSPSYIYYKAMRDYMDKKRFAAIKYWKGTEWTKI